MHRRKFIAATSIVAVTAFAGCQETIEDWFEGEISGTGEPVKVNSEAMAEAGFEYVGSRSYEIEEEFDLAGEPVQVNLGNWVAAYERPASDMPEDLPDEAGNRTAVFGVASTPSFEVAEESVNIVDIFDDEDLISLANEELDDVSINDIEHVRTETQYMLNQNTDIDVFTADMETDAGVVEATVYLSQVSHEGDRIISVGAHPSVVDHRPAVYRMKEGIEHPVDESDA